MIYAKACRECESDFETKLAFQVYCSSRCRRAPCDRVANERKKQKRLAKVRTYDTKPHICRTCGLEFQALQSSNRLYCSLKCRSKMSNSKKKVVRKVVGTDARECMTCQKPIIVRGKCYDCAVPGNRYIQPAAWLYERRKGVRFGEDGGAIAVRIAA